jgi:hypothetical protein
MGAAQTAPRSAVDLANLSYIDLLDMDNIPRFSEDQLKTAENQLKSLQKVEQKRLEQEEEQLDSRADALRNQLDELGKGRSRDTPEISRERALLQCRILDVEAREKETETARNHGVPVQYQNKIAKLDLIQQWPQLRAEIERKIEFGQARERRFGNIEDIGVRDLGIEDLAEKQAEDIKIGQDAIREMKSHGLMPPVVEDQALTTYVQRLAENIARNSDLRVPVKVTVLDSEEINAFALPGGYLFVNSGLINKTETESELVGVIAHELAHDAARHGARLTKRANIASIFYQAAQIATSVFLGPVGLGVYYGLQYGFVGLGMILDLSLLGVSRDYESEADQLGAQYAWKAGFDPKGFVTFFDKMASEEGYVRSASFFRTHPPFLERIISTFSEISYLPAKRDLRVTSTDYDRAKERIKVIVAEREEEDKNKPTLRVPGLDCKEAGRPIS